MKKKRLKFLFFILCLFFAVADVSAKELIKTCTYVYEDSLSGKSARAELLIYDNYTTKGYITIYDGKSLVGKIFYKKGIGAKIYGFDEDTYKKSNKCPDYARILHLSANNTITLSDTKTDLTNNDNPRIGVSNEHVASEEESKTYYDSIVSSTEHITEVYTSYSFDTCKDGQDVSKCETIYKSLNTYMNNSDSEVALYIQQGYITKDNEKTQAYYAAVKAAKKKWKEVRSELDDYWNKILGKEDDDSDSNDNAGTAVEDTCQGLLGNSEFYKYLQDVFDLIQLGGSICALVFGMTDMLKAVASGEDDAKKKSFKNFGRRLTAAVLLYLIPAILTMILNLVDNLNGSTCGLS